MDRVITYSFRENFISRLADYIEDNFLKENEDLSKIAVVFGGKRPALFLKKELARRIKKSFFPPVFFSIDEFINYILAKRINFRYISDLDACYLIYRITEEVASDILKERQKFSQFIPWAREIKTFIDELDLEDIEAKRLVNIQVAADIGYEIPESINTLLKHIIAIRDKYHKTLVEKETFPRGFIYLKAARLISEIELEEFNKILLCNFFYLHRTEEKIIKHLYDREKAILLFQKDNRDWSAFKRMEKMLSSKIEAKEESDSKNNIFLAKGFDIHSQVGLVRETLKNIDNLDNTVIVLPEADHLMPLLPEISSSISEFNVSLGYPLKRSSLYGLFNSIFKAQLTRKGNVYYTGDYLKVLTHPLIKNLKIAGNPVLSRILAHKIEEILLGMEESELGGSLFIKLEDIEETRTLYLQVLSTLNQMDIFISEEELERILKDVHRAGFRIWEDIESFQDFSYALNEFLNILMEKSFIGNYPLNLKVVEKAYILRDELVSLEFKEDKFPLDEIYKIFINRLDNEMISFSGSPLKGLQILGMLETRALHFENVIIMDVNESVLPRLRLYEPLIPRQIMISLGLNRLQQEEEIQRYHFRRLIDGAKNVYLIYDDSAEKVKSRFLEEIIWEQEKKERRLKVFLPQRATFNVEFLPRGVEVKKNPRTIEILKNFVYSPSSIDTYLQCPLQFYYRYVLKIKPKEDLLAEIEGEDVGNFIHKLLEDMFMEFLRKKPRLDKKFQKRFFKEFQIRFNESFRKRIGPSAFMVEYIMKYRLEKFLGKEMQRKVKRILSLEDETLGGRIKLDKGVFEFKCKIDRIDELEDESILIIDYKTGSSASAPKSLNKLQEMGRQEIKERIKSFQLPLYFYFVRERFRNQKINAVLYNLRDLEMVPFLKDSQDENVNEIMEICLKALDFIIGEILNPDVAFKADKSKVNLCNYCFYSALCR